MIAKRIFALLAAAALALTLAAPCARASYYTDEGHYDTAFEDMPVTGIDLKEVDAFCRRFYADPVGQYGALLRLVDEMETQLSLLDVISSSRAGDETAAAAYEQARNAYTYASDRLYAAISRALSGTHGAELRALMPPDEADSFADYTAASDEDLALSEQETELIQKYLLLPDGDGFADAAAEIYLQLAALRREQAKNAGFDSYADYAYASSFAREYVPEDAKRLQNVVKTRLAPLYARCEWALAYSTLPWNNDDVPDGAAVISAIADSISVVSPELREAMDFLLRNHLYRIGSGDDMQDMGYTVSLPAYRSAFLFNKVTTRFEAYQSTVHEFGHFNAAYHDPAPSLYAYSDIDVAEVQSQGLEMLFIPQLQSILVPGGDDSDRALVTLFALRGLLASVVDGCLYDEFEQAVYADPSMTVEGLHQLEARLNTEYGLDELYEPGVFWPYITHLFEQPFYYISYAASALPALDLYLKSTKDYAAAVDAYLKISAASGNDWFLDVMDENGLCNVTDRSDVVRVAGELEARLEALIAETPSGSLFDGAGRLGGGDDTDALYGAVIVLAALNILLLVIVIVQRVKLSRRAAADEPSDVP